MDKQIILKKILEELSIRFSRLLKVLSWWFERKKIGTGEAPKHRAQIYRKSGYLIYEEARQIP